MMIAPGLGAAVAAVSLSSWLLTRRRRSRDRFVFEDYQRERSGSRSSYGSGGSGPRVYVLQNVRRSTESSGVSSWAGSEARPSLDEGLVPTPRDSLDDGRQRQQEGDTPAAAEEAAEGRPAGPAPQSGAAAGHSQSGSKVKEQVKALEGMQDGQLRAREAEHIAALTKARQEAQQLRAREKKQAEALREVQQELHEMQRQRTGHISALEEAQQESVQLRTMNRNLVAQVEQLEDALRSVSSRESGRVRQLESELAEATALVSSLEAECEMLEAMAGVGDGEEGSVRLRASEDSVRLSRRVSEDPAKAGPPSTPSPPTPPGTEAEGRRKEHHPSSASKAARAVDFAAA